MTKLWGFSLEFLVLGVLANVVAHYAIKYYEESRKGPEPEAAA